MSLKRCFPRWIIANESHSWWLRQTSSLLAEGETPWCGHLKWLWHYLWCRKTQIHFYVLFSCSIINIHLVFLRTETCQEWPLKLTLPGDLDLTVTSPRWCYSKEQLFILEKILDLQADYSAIFISFPESQAWLLRSPSKACSVQTDSPHSRFPCSKHQMKSLLDFREVSWFWESIPEGSLEAIIYYWW